MIDELINTIIQLGWESYGAEEGLNFWSELLDKMGREPIMVAEKWWALGYLAHCEAVYESWASRNGVTPGLGSMSLANRAIFFAE